jgi:hypothetical protein
MNTREIADTLTTLLGELVDGPPPDAAYMLNRGDDGLLRSLDKLTAGDASGASDGGASIAAHVDHLRYGLSLMNRWSGGQNPFDSADWAASWRIGPVSDAEWQRLRNELREEAHRWMDALRPARDVNRLELNGIVDSIAHIAYHLGAIRQIDRRARGPAESEAAAS